MTDKQICDRIRGALSAFLQQNLPELPVLRPRKRSGGRR